VTTTGRIDVPTEAGQTVLRDWLAKEPDFFRFAPTSKRNPEPAHPTHDEWERGRAFIEAKIDAHRPGAPAWWSPLAAEQPQAWTESHRYGWALVYHAHHFLLRSPYGFLLGGAMLVTVGLAWFERRRMERERREQLERQQKEQAEREAHRKRREEEQRQWNAQQAALARQAEQRRADSIAARDRVGARGDRAAALDAPTEIQRVPPAFLDHAPTDRDVRAPLLKEQSPRGDDDVTGRDPFTPDRPRQPARRDRRQRPPNQVRRPKPGK
jgi:hypothetical protein